MEVTMQFNKTIGFFTLALTLLAIFSPAKASEHKFILESNDSLNEQDLSIALLKIAKLERKTARHANFLLTTNYNMLTPEDLLSHVENQLMLTATTLSAIAIILDKDQSQNPLNVQIAPVFFQKNNAYNEITQHLQNLSTAQALIHSDLNTYGTKDFVRIHAPHILASLYDPSVECLLED
jgi:hypothetical protein